MRPAITIMRVKRKPGKKVKNEKGVRAHFINGRHTFGATKAEARLTGKLLAAVTQHQCLKETMHHNESANVDCTCMNNDKRTASGRISEQAAQLLCARHDTKAMRVDSAHLASQPPSQVYCRASRGRDKASESL